MDKKEFEGLVATAEEIALVIKNDVESYCAARNSIKENMQSPLWVIQRAAKAAQLGLSRDDFEWGSDLRCIVEFIIAETLFPNNKLAVILKKVITDRIYKFRAHFATPNPIKKEEIPMSKFNFDLPSQKFTRVFGVETTNASDAELIEMIREATKEMDSYDDIIKVSTKVQKRCAAIQKSINILVEQLDKK